MTAADKLTWTTYDTLLRRDFVSFAQRCFCELSPRTQSGPVVPAVSHAFAAFEQRDFCAAIDALEPIAGELERIGGSRTQLDLVEFTLLKGYLGADRLDDARRMLSGRHRGSSSIPLVGLGAVH